MYVARQIYPVMQGEPHLGNIIESELIAENEEIFYLISESAIESGAVPDVVFGIDDYSGEEIEIETYDYITKEQAEEIDRYIECSDVQWEYKADEIFQFLENNIELVYECEDE